jgi:CRP/FNR family transcriptional regulator, cyclic AMP receptor protein
MSCETTPIPLAARARSLSSAELRDIPWLHALQSQERERAVDDLRVVQVHTGELLCRVGKPPTYWFGVIDGLLKMSNDTAMGVPITFTGVPPGGWFGEGTVIKREAYRYNIQALRNSTVAGISVETFHCAREIDRLSDPDVRVARSLAALFHPLLYPGVGSLLRITQTELGYLVGLSRQRVNKALHHLQDAALIRIEYGGLRVLDLDGLRKQLRRSAS